MKIETLLHKKGSAVVTVKPGATIAQAVELLRSWARRPVSGSFSTVRNRGWRVVALSPASMLRLGPVRAR